MPAGKHKGGKDRTQRPGLGRLRRANHKQTARLGGWADRVEDDAYLERHGQLGRRSHAGESLLARFNRLARDLADGAGEPGEVCGVEGTAIQVRLDDGRELPCSIRRRLKKLVSGESNPLCVGDRVRVDCGDDPVVTAVLPRRNQLARADSHNRSLEHVFAANVDLLLVVAATTGPDFKPGLVDRYLAIAAFNGVPAALAITKCDLAPAQHAELYRNLELPVFTLGLPPDGEPAGDLAGLRGLLAGRTCVFAGQSGTGKSSLLNALHPGCGARVGLVASEGFGRHTTVSAHSFLMPDGSRIIDTPGIRECTLAGLSPLDLALHYRDIARLHPHCHFRDCTHLHEPGCAVRAAAETGSLAATRYESYRSIVAEDLRPT